MSAEQREWFREYLNTHPKNTLQPVKAEALWAEKVTEYGLARWLIDTLKRECVGDTTYVRGPWRWLEDHLVLYANGVRANMKQENPSAYIDASEYDRRAKEAASGEN